MKDRIGDWTQTYSGRRFYPLDPRTGDFDIEDIARGLAHCPRYSGQTRTFYSVAQHSLMVMHLSPPEHKLCGLMHDASDAYIGDLARPIKHEPSIVGFRHVENSVMHAIAQQFGFAWPEPPEVKNADNVALVTERRDLCPNAEPWHLKWADIGIHARDEPIRVLPPDAAMRAFLAAFHHLTRKEAA